jgi:poly-gamma-glutamate capsule biosynthesis protein CapA/YwtB (metallophosphatase superfamily)
MLTLLLACASPPPQAPPPAPPPEPTPVVISAALPEAWRAAVGAALEAAGEGGPFEVLEAGGVVGGAVAVGPDVGEPVLRRIFVPVRPFGLPAEGLRSEALGRAWAEGRVVIRAGDAAALAAALGEGQPRAVADKAALRAALEADPMAVGLLPFDALDPGLQALTLDGLSALDKGLDEAAWPLQLAVGASDPAVAARVAAALAGEDSRDPEALVTLVITGTSALTRGMAGGLEANGYDWPAAVVGETFAAADITTVSHEVPFTEQCPPAHPRGTLKFCARPPYFATLAAVGADAVGLTGQHVLDYGPEAASESLALYAAQGVPVYGGGADVQQACAALRLERGGRTFAFLGALDWGLDHAFVSDTQPGACSWATHRHVIEEQIVALKAEGAFVSVEIQMLETMEDAPPPDQVETLRRLRGLGADLATGISSHVPKSFEVYGAGDPGPPGFIAWGLGNLFFDQMFSTQVRSQLYLRHTVYRGRLLQTEVLAGVLEDYGQPRWATDEERRALLTRLMAAAPAPDTPAPAAPAPDAPGSP